jgi:hypothetical protein
VPDHDEAIRRHGPGRRRTPHDAAARFAGFEGRWWIAGGWAIDAFAGSTREHADLDIGTPRESIAAFLRFAFPGSEVRAAAEGTLTPLLPGDEHRLPDGCGNLWLRPRGAAAWEYDVLLERVHGDTWIFKRDARITRPLAACLREQHGLAYLRPEIQLLLKAEHARPKDAFDLERCLPLLDPGDVAWLAASLRLAHPGHPWIERVERISGGTAPTR